ncbi:MAG: S8 family serine peptidase [Patescibacteria group bacterium]|jgi:hypothetical protein
MQKKFFIFLFIFFFTATPVLAETPDDLYLDKQWYLGQIDAFTAWNTTTGSDDVVVAILDTGIDTDHPDLVGHFWQNTDEIADDGIDNDHNGYIDDVEGWDFVRNDATVEPEYTTESFDADAILHGTFVAGIIGAQTDNDEGIAGLNWKIKLMPVRILDRFGSGDSRNATAAVEYAVANGADVINFSLTGTTFDSSFLSAAKTAHEAGVIMVAALGNESESVNDIPIYPACFASQDGLIDYVIGVAASDMSDERASFSNYGSSCADISAPGVDIFSTLLQDDTSLEFTDYYGGNWDGTSLAAPMISGAAALLRAAYPGITPDEVKLVLQLSVDPLKEKGTIAVGQLGAGRLNISKAIELGASFASSAGASSISKVSSGFLATAPAGDSSLVRIFDAHGNRQTEFYAYDENFGGGVRLAMGDVDGDGVDEIVTGPGPGGGPQVRVFETDGTLIKQFFAYSTSDTHGIFVGVGDTDGDGVGEILTAPDKGGNGEVRWFEMNGEQNGFIKPFGVTPLSLRVAAGDTNNDGTDEIIVGTGSGHQPTVSIFSGTGTFIKSFEAYATTYDKGIYVEAGDLDSDGVDEIVTGTDYGGGPHVRAFEADGTVMASFFAYDEFFRGGVRVAVADLDDNGSAEIYTAAGPGGGPHLRVFNASGTTIGGFFPFSDSLNDGIFVAGW